MLRRIEIKGLYGHYDYDLPLISGIRKNICFLTGPNGYGKSTILDLIAAFVKVDVKTFLNIPYDTITFYLKDYKVVLTQERTEETVGPNDDFSSSDDDLPIIRKMTIVVYAAENGEALEGVSFTEDEIEAENVILFPPSLSVYLASQHVEYITDDRLWPRNADKLGVNKSVELLQMKIANYDNHLTAMFNESMLGAMRSLSPEDFVKGELEEHELIKRTNEKLEAFNKLGLASKLISAEVKEEKPFLKMLQLAAADRVLRYDDMFYRRLKLLYDMIVQSDFSDKKLVLDGEHGLFFISDDTIIIPEELSSGEQHFIIQLITLLMKAEPQSLILIDEPELSYHPAWQMDYLKNLKRIAEIGHYQFVLATHSPQIFDYKWGYTIDLYKQTTDNAERPEERN